jgi:hypothetical protein
MFISTAHALRVIYRRECEHRCREMMRVHHTSSSNDHSRKSIKSNRRRPTCSPEVSLDLSSAVHSHRVAGSFIHNLGEYRRRLS